MVDQQQAISDDLSGSGFYCPADIFAVDRPYNAAVALKYPEQSVSGLEKQESRDESKKTTDIKRKRSGSPPEADLRPTIAHATLEKRCMGYARVVADAAM